MEDDTGPRRTSRERVAKKLPDGEVSSTDRTAMSAATRELRAQLSVAKRRSAPKKAKAKPKTVSKRIMKKSPRKSTHGTPATPAGPSGATGVIPVASALPRAETAAAEIAQTQQPISLAKSTSNHTRTQGTIPAGASGINPEALTVINEAATRSPVARNAIRNIQLNVSGSPSHVNPVSDPSGTTLPQPGSDFTQPPLGKNILGSGAVSGSGISANPRSPPTYPGSSPTRATTNDPSSGLGDPLYSEP